MEVVISPQVSLDMIFPFSVSLMVTNLSVEDEIRNVPVGSRRTLMKSCDPVDFSFSGFFSKTFSPDVKSSTYRNLS